jgi:hypothetical protein
MTKAETVGTAPWAYFALCLTIPQTSSSLWSWIFARNGEHSDWNIKGAIQNHQVENELMHSTQRFMSERCWSFSTASFHYIIRWHQLFNSVDSMLKKAASLGYFMTFDWMIGIFSLGQNTKKHCHDVSVSEMKLFWSWWCSPQTQIP